MLTVDQYDYIRTAYRVYGKKIKEIARETGHSKNTIKRALRGEYIGYKPRGEQQPYPVLGPYLGVIDGWLEADKDSPKKQRHTAVRVFHRLDAYSAEIATWFQSIPPLRSEALRHPCRSVATLVILCCQNFSF